MIKKFLFITLVCISTLVNSQIHEIGITLGGSNYIGDVGRETFIYPNSYAIGGIYKYNLNPRMAFRGNLTYFKLTDNDANSNNIGRQMRALNFTNTLFEVAGGIEFNYFDYDLSGRDKTHTPYILLQIAAMNYKAAVSGTPGDYEYKNKTALAIPFGLGYKTKIIGKLAGAVEVGLIYTFSDDLDYNNPYIDRLNFGNQNNHDWYVFSGINLVYTFGRPSCYAPR
jgi:hypothetical protein